MNTTRRLFDPCWLQFESPDEGNKDRTNVVWYLFHSNCVTWRKQQGLRQRSYVIFIVYHLTLSDIWLLLYLTTKFKSGTIVYGRTASRESCFDRQIKQTLEKNAKLYYFFSTDTNLEIYLWINGNYLYNFRKWGVSYQYLLPV